MVLKSVKIKQTTLICQCAKRMNANHSGKLCPTYSYFFQLCTLHNHLHHYHAVSSRLSYTSCLVLAGPEANEPQGGEDRVKQLLCPEPRGPHWVAMSVGFVQTPFCIITSVCSCWSLFFSPVMLLRSVISLVGGTGLDGAEGCWHHAGQGISPLRFSGSWSSSAG